MKETRYGTLAAEKQANRSRGFPLAWAVSKATGQLAGCDGPTRRKRDKHVEVRWNIDRPSGRTRVCVACCTHQEFMAIRWAADHGDQAKAFR